ncbi:MAG: hypothetical protein NTW78_07195 [Campylobacterales bacterium]|nr:hypothetical protein [Campylobacterales bacterium]
MIALSSFSLMDEKHDEFLAPFSSIQSCPPSEFMPLFIDSQLAIFLKDLGAP